MNDEAKQILDTVYVGAMATVMKDGSPHATAIHFARHEDSIVWISPGWTRHAKNAVRSGKLSFVVWDDQKRAVHLTTNAQPVSDEEREKVLESYKKKLGDFLPPLDDLTFYLSPIGKLDENNTTQNIWHFVA